MAVISVRRAAVRAGFDAVALQRAGVSALLFAAIGVESMVLATWMPDTLAVWFSPEKNGFGDFPVFYHNAQSISLNAFYSPGLSLLMHPLTWFSMRTAFTIYFAINIGALAGVAYLAQRGVASAAAKVAVALAIFALPQTHWALRVGHFTEILAFASLGGLLLCDRRSVVAGLLIGVLALKPQYLPVPLLYFACTRNWRALGASVGSLALLGVAGVAAMAVRDGSVYEFAHTARYYIDGIATDASFLTLGQRDQAYQQGWQYSWYGFLVSAGIDRNPLIAAELFAISGGAMLLAWWRCSASVAKVATALGMLLLTPHTSFYNWSMLAVAAALLLRSDLRPRALVPLMLVGMAAAAAATQNATPFPLPYDAYRPAGTLGLYWVQPAALACIAALAIIGDRGKRQSAAAINTANEDVPTGVRAVVRATPTLALASNAEPRRPPSISRYAPSMVLAATALVAIASGAVASAYVSASGPFRGDAYFERSAVLQALPADFPRPADAEIAHVGAGSQLPYRIEWQSPAPTSDVAALMRTRLDDGSWKIVDATENDGAITMRSARAGDGMLPPVVAELRITAGTAGSTMRLEFAPLPVSLVPGYDAWLQHLGLVVHSVDPASDAANVPLR